MIPPVSRETEAKLRHYIALLEKWQKAINLVSPKTIPQAWERHILDSLQLASFIAENRIVFDFGSGAGFPGMVLAIARPDLKITLFESDNRKCSFMQAVSRETQTPVTVINHRIETLPATEIPDAITARALASLKDLLSLSLPYAQLNSKLILLFLKGGQVGQEINEAKALYDFSHRLFPSETDIEGRILSLESLCIKGQL